MTIRRYIMMMLVIAITGSASAQNNRFSIELRGGLMGGALRDEIYSPLNYDLNKGFSAGVGLQYSFGRSLVEIDLGFSSANAVTSVSNSWTANYYSVKIGASYLYRLWDNGSNLNLYLGGGYSFAGDGMLLGRENYTYIVAHNFSPIARLEYLPHSRHKLSGEASFALFALVSRPPFNRMPDHYESEWRSHEYYLFREWRKVRFSPIGKYWDVNLSVGYDFAATSWLSLGARYAFRYQRYNEFEPPTLCRNSLIFNIRFTL